MSDDNYLSDFKEQFIYMRIEVRDIILNFHDVTKQPYSLYETEIPSLENFNISYYPSAIVNLFCLQLLLIDTIADFIHLEDDLDYQNSTNRQKQKLVQKCLGKSKVYLEAGELFDVDVSDLKSVTDNIKLLIDKYRKRIDSLINIILFYKDILADKYQKVSYRDIVMHSQDIEDCIEIAKVLGLTDKQAHYVGGIMADLPFPELCKFVGSKQNTVGKLKIDVCKKLGFKPVSGEADNYRIKHYIQSLNNPDALEAAKAIFQGNIDDKTELAKSYKENKDIADIVRNNPELLKIIEAKIAEGDLPKTKPTIHIEHYQYFKDNPELFKAKSDRD